MSRPIFCSHNPQCILLFWNRALANVQVKMRCFRVSFSPVCLMSVHKRSICLRHNRETQRERIQEEHIFKPRLTGAWGSWNRFPFTSFRKKQLHCHLIQIYLFICFFYWNRSWTWAGAYFLLTSVPRTVPEIKGLQCCSQLWNELLLLGLAWQPV